MTIRKTMLAALAACCLAGGPALAQTTSQDPTAAQNAMQQAQAQAAAAAQAQAIAAQTAQLQAQMQAYYGGMFPGEEEEDKPKTKYRYKGNDDDPFAGVDMPQRLFHNIPRRTRHGAF